MISTRQETSSTHPVDLFKAAAMTHSWSTVALRRQRLIHDRWRPPGGQYEHGRDGFRRPASPARLVHRPGCRPENIGASGRPTLRKVLY